MSRRFEISLLGVAALVVLRVALGWHFLYQGLGKLSDPDFSSAGFLRQAKGPLADRYHALIPDLDGRQRLAEGGQAVIQRLQRRFDAAVAHYGMSDDQQASLREMLEHRQAQVRELLARQSSEIADYLHELDRWQQKQDPHLAEVGFQRKRVWDKQQELRSRAAPWLASLEATERAFEDDVRHFLRPEQKARGTPDEPPTQLDWADRIVTWSNLTIGVCLIAGLFTRLAGAGAALFLLTIVLAQPPWPTIYPPDPPSAGRSLLVNKEVIEMLACAAMAALPVGRWGGLDFFLHRYAVRRQARRHNV